MEQEKVQLTKSGLENKQKELRELLDVIRPQVIADLAAARAQGDLSENADYDAARNKQAEVEGRIKELEAIINNCEIISEEGNKKDKKCRLGSTVEIEDLSDNTKATYSIVGTVEADPFNGKVSQDCELGKALIGAKSGDVVTVKVAQPYEVKVLKVEN